MRQAVIVLASGTAYIHIYTYMCVYVQCLNVSPVVTHTVSYMYLTHTPNG